MKEVSAKCILEFKNNEDVLLKFSKSQERIIRNRKNSYIMNLDITINEFVELSKHSKKNIKLFMGLLPNSFVEKTKNDIGFDLSNVSLVLSSSDINHTLRQHGIRGIKTKNGDYAVENNDLNHLADILEKYYTVTLNNNGQEDRLIFITNDLGNELFYKTIEVVLKNGHELILKDLMKRKKSFIHSVG